MSESSTTMGQRNAIRRYGIFAALFLSLLTFIVYLPALQNGFVNWDDQIYVYENQNIRAINIDFIKWSFLPNPTGGHWHPVTWLSFALDYSLWGMNPMGFHFTNIILHSINTFLVFVLSIRLIEEGPKGQGVGPDTLTPVISASIAAILFGIHPVHVESVAWVTERKDVLCLSFFLLTIIYYLKYISSQGPKKRPYYIASLLFFTMALMAKSMAVTLPVVLLILDFYPVRRFTGKEIKWVIIEKVPFFLLSLISSFLTLWAARLAGMGTSQPFTFITRLFISAWGYIFYLVKIIFPFNLAPLYPYPEKVNIFAVDYLGAAILVLSITIYCLWSLRRGRLFLAVWLSYVVTLIPVIGIVHTGPQDTADRYTYMPSIGLFLLIGLAVGAIFERYPKRALHITILLIIILGSLINKTVKQVGVWHDSVTLWTHEIKLLPNAYRAYFNRGNAYDEIGAPLLALKDYDKAVELQPDFADVYFNRGCVLGRLGGYNQALKDLDRAIELDPKKSEAYNNRGSAYFSLGNSPMAMKDYKRAFELDPRNAEAYYNLGFLYVQTGDMGSALTYYKKAASLGLKEAQDYLNKSGLNSGK